MSKKVKVNKDACIGCGLCVSTAPEVFAFDDEGKSQVIGVAKDEAALNDIIAACPVGAIEEEKKK
jgi:ferredoxin